MKVSAQEQYENNIDALLFAYVEGELAEEEAKHLEEKLTANSSLQAELEHWKESFVTQDFYPTEKLEKNLLKEKVNPINPATSTFIFIIALTAFLLSFLPLSVEKTPVTDQLNSRVPMPVKKKEEILQPAEPVMEKEQFPAIIANRNTAKAIVRKNIQPRKVMIQHLPTPSVIPLETGEATILHTILETQTKKLLTKKTASKRSITRKEQRKIIRLKESALQQRKANEFLKGNIPYVVPLNTNNF